MELSKRARSTRIPCSGARVAKILVASVLLVAAARGQASPVIPLDGASGESYTDTSPAWAIESAEAARSAGMLNVAAALYSAAIDQAAQGSPIWERLIIDRAGVLIEDGDPQRALNELAALTGGSARYHLFRAMALVETAQWERARLALDRIREDALSTSERVRYFIAEAVVLNEEGRAEARDVAFERAFELATPAERPRVTLARMQNLVRAEAFGDDLIIELEERVREEEAAGGGFRAARLLSLVYAFRGRQTDSERLLTDRLDFPSADESGFGDQLKLLTGVILGVESERGRDAVQSLLLDKEADRQVRETALHLLIDASRLADQRSALANFVDRLLETYQSGDALYSTIKYQRAWLHVANNQFVPARKVLADLVGEAVERDDRVRALGLLAFIALNQKPPAFREAANHFQSLAEVALDDSRRARFFRLMGDAFFADGDFSSAAGAYQNAFSLAAGEQRGLMAFQLVSSLLTNGQIEQAVAFIDDHRAMVIDSDYYWRTEWNLLTALKASGREGQALERLARLLANDGSPAKQPALKARMTWLHGQLLFDTGQTAKAQAKASDILILAESGQIEPRLRAELASRAWILRAQALLAGPRTDTADQTDSDGTSQIEDALAALQLVRERYPGTESAALAYLIEARHHASLGLAARAQSRFQELADAYPESTYAPVALFEAALTVERRGRQSDRDEALNLLRRLVESYPNTALVYYAQLKIADISRANNNFPFALLTYEQVIKQFPDHPERFRAEMMRADCLVEMGGRNPDRLAGAMAAYERLSARPGVPRDVQAEAGFKWARSLEKEGRIDRAAGIYWTVKERYFTQDANVGGDFGERGRYWVSRAILRLAEIREGQRAYSEAIAAYRAVAELGLPGTALARAKLDALLRKADS